MKYLLSIVLFACCIISVANADIVRTRIVQRDRPVVRIDAQDKVEVRIWRPFNRLRVRVNTPIVKVEVGK
jgi:translation initiation factor IF-1